MEDVEVRAGDRVVFEDPDDGLGVKLKPRDLISLKDGHVVFIESVEGSTVTGYVLYESKVEELRSRGIID